MERAAILILMLSAILCLAPSGRRKELAVAAVSGVCIQHIGESDKPIFPIILAIGAQAEDACRAFVGTDSRYAATFRVSQKELTPVAEYIRRSTKSEPDAHDYGTFRWTIVTGNRNIQVVTSRRESGRLLERMIEAFENKELNAALQSTRARLH